jgi:hypothetical protein
MEKNEGFRIISARFPEIVERLISLWGSAELGRYINGLLRKTSSDAKLNMGKEVDMALIYLQAAHDSEYPRHAVSWLSEISDTVIQSENFKVINREYPHVGRRIAVSWGRPDFTPYVNDLINNSRDGKRAGFPREVAVALFRLMQEHDVAYPQHQLKVADIWGLNNES